MQNQKGKSRLGRGLSSLLNLSDEVANASSFPELPKSPSNAPLVAQRSAHEISPSGPPSAGLVALSVQEIQPNPHQPRRDFDEKSLAALAASLKSTGLIQPIIVRPSASGYELIAGERRWRAAKLAGLTTLPAIIKEADSFSQAQMALIENIQREDLNPIDRAMAYRSLLDQLGLTQAELATRLGEDRSAIAHFTRLLDLEPVVREKIRTGVLSVGHGKLLAGVSDAAAQIQLSERIEKDALSVRGLEKILGEEKSDASKKKSATKPSAHIVDLEGVLSRQLGMKVQMKWSAKSKRGKMTIFYTLDQFEELKHKLGVTTD